MVRYRNPQRGQALLMMTLSLILIFGMLGLAVDLGWAYFRQQAAQAAADAAAIAAVRTAVNKSASSQVCGSSGVWCGAASNCPATAPGSAASSFDSACMLASANGFTTANQRTVSVQANTTNSVPTQPGPSVVYWATVRVSENTPILFGAAFGRGGFSPGARASAAAFGSAGGGSCIYVLDPHASNAFQAGNGAQVTIDCGIYVDSDAKSPTQAMYVTGGATIQAPTIQVVGNFKKDNGASTSVTPSTGVTATADPFKDLPAPTPGTPQSGDFTKWQASPYTPPPGTYNGFSVANGMSLIMSGGTYIISGGTFSIQGGSTVTATGGVMIYLTNGATVNIANGATVTLAAQSSGAYQGVLFYQDRSMLSPGTSYFAGGANMNFTGSLYLPHALLNIDNGTNTSGSTMAIVAGTLNFQGGAHFLADNGGSKTGLTGGFTFALIE